MNKPKPLVSGSSHIDLEYTTTQQLGKGTFGEVSKAVHKSTGTIVAIKRILLHNEKEGFPVTALREIEILQNLDHEHVVPLLEMSVKRGDRITKKRFSAYMIMPYMEYDLAGLLDNPAVNLTLAQIKLYMRQLLEGINYIHQSGFLHRDIKTANILISQQGTVKIADFGLARRYYGKLPSVTGSGERHSSRRYTGTVVTRWYRAPELVLGDTSYTTAIDLWGLGCIFGEVFRKKPILRGVTDADQGLKIFKLVGSPTEQTMPGYEKLPGASLLQFGHYERTLEKEFHDLTPESLSLLSGLLTLDPLARFSALGALDHAFFHTAPKEAKPADLPIYSDSHEMNTRQRQKAPNVTAYQKQKDHEIDHLQPPSGLGLPSRPKFNSRPRVPPYRRQGQADVGGGPGGSSGHGHGHGHGNSGGNGRHNNNGSRAKLPPYRLNQQNDSLNY